MCKPHKMNGYRRGRGLETVNKTGFSNQRKEYLASKDLKEAA
ncbi:hypothetical protein SAMN05216404_106168 [Nitrosospira multiformis]|uniref:Uncharacterized protein n=2 Tax=Nitrosospira multiformis TaxID=1231 RepID=A0A1H8IUT4_9PROT|nr:hypothetical protein SAMN05216404_106168 [Nitrosospira multiformis]